MATDEVIEAMANVGKENAKAAWEIAKAVAKLAKDAATGGNSE